MLRRSFLQTALALPALALPPEGAARQPLYFLLYSRFTDHLHPDFAMATFKVALPKLRALQQQGNHPGLRWLVQCSGAFAGSVGDFAGEHSLVTLLRHAQQEGLLEFGYDGSEEPTPRWRPMPNFRHGASPESRWLARLEAAEWFLTEHKHPVKGTPDPSGSGGLLRMREVFGDPVMISGYSQEIGRDSEFTHLFRKWRLHALLPGTPESFSYPARNIPGYSGGIADFGKRISPGPKDVPELFWQDGYLRLSRATHRTMTGIPLYQGKDAVRNAIEALPRDRPHIVQLELGHPSAFVREDAPADIKASPLLYAYEHPKEARVPDQYLRFAGDWEALAAAEWSTIDWLRDELFAQEPGSRFVHVGDLLRMAESRLPRTVRPVGLRELAEALLRGHAISNHPPALMMAEGRYFSLAECYHLLATHLAAGMRESELPVIPLYGPSEIGFAEGARNGDVDRGALVAELQPWLHSQPAAWTRYPANRIPAWTTVNALRLNAAQVLLLLAGFVADPGAARLPAKPVYTYSALAGSFASSVDVEELGAVWTTKPAPIEG